MRVGRTRIASPKSLKIRPTTAFVRKVLFDTIGPAIRGAAFLDLFAGTGSVGLEALMRGASSAVFVEADRSVAKVLRSNIQMAGLSGEARLVLRDAVSFTRRGYKPAEFDLVFADPPYEKGFLGPLVNLLCDADAMPSRLVAIQTSKFEAAEMRLPEGLAVREKTIGDTVLLFFSVTA